EFPTVRPATRQSFGDENVADVLTTNPNGGECPAIPISSARLHHEGIAAEQLCQPSTGALGQSDFGGTTTNVVVGLRGVKGLQTQVDAVEPYSVAIHHAGVSVATTHSDINPALSRQ